MTCDFGGSVFFQSATLIGPLGKFVDHLPQNANALPHFFDANEIAIVAIARAADDHVEVVFVVIEIGMFAAQIVFDAAAAQVRTGKRVSDGAILRDYADVFCAIDEDAIAREEIDRSHPAAE